MKASYFRTKVVTAAAATIVSIGISAPSHAYVMELVDLYGDFDGDTLSYNFTGLSTAAGDGTLRLRTGVSQSTSFDGLDLDSDDEYFDLSVDGNSAGRYACGTHNGSTVLLGNTGGLDCDFDVTLSFLNDFGLDLASLVADGSLLVEAAFSIDVNFSSENDELFATLSYEELRGPAAVPAPATLTIFGLGLAGLGWSRRKKA